MGDDKDKNEKLDSDALQTIIGAVFEGLANATKGGDFNIDSAKALPEAVTNMVAQSLENAGRADDAAALRKEAAEQLRASRAEAQADMAAARAAAAEPKAPDDKPDPIKDGLQNALGQFVAEKAAEGESPELLLLDEKFLGEHGSELAGRMLGAFAKALIPKEPFEIDMKVPDPGAGDKDVKVKLDLGKMLAGFLQPLTDPDSSASVSISATSATLQGAQEEQGDNTEG